MRSALHLRVTFLTRVACGLELERISFPSVSRFRSIDNCQTTQAGPHARSSGTMSRREEVVDRQSGNRSADPRYILS